MARIVASLSGFGLLVGILFLPALFFDDAGEHAKADPAVYEPTSITSYVAEFTVDEDGGMDVVETLTVDFPIGSALHGIFRFFDRLDPSAPDIRHRISDTEVTYDGEAVPVDRSQQDVRYDVLRIGDADAFVPSGQHVYEISYHVTSALTPGDDVDDPTQFYWNLVPQGWQQEIAETDLTVHLPATADDVQCAIGVGEDDTGACQVAGEGTTDLRIRTGALDDHTPVTVLVGQDLPTPDLTTLPWSPRFDRVVGSRPWMLGLSLLLGLAGAGLVGLWLRQTRDPEPPFPLQYAPPDGIGPAQGHYVIAEETGRPQFVASLMHAAERGAVHLQHRSNGSWAITNREGSAGLVGLDAVTKSLGSLIGAKEGEAFVANRGDVMAGSRLSTAYETHRIALEKWVNKQRILEKCGPGWKGLGLILLAIVLELVWLGLTLGGAVDVSMFALPLAAIGGLGLPLLKGGAGTRRTAEGRDLWSRVGGFRRMLATDSAEARFDFAGREDLYPAYLPWAVAFGCADRWSEKFRIETGQVPPLPPYLDGTDDDLHQGSGGPMIAAMVGDFDSTLGKAIGAYSAAQAASSSSSSSSDSSSSSSSFSGGGGGGGGGGGSW